MDEELLKDRLRLLEEYIKDLEEARGVDLKKFEKNKVVRRFVERTLQLAMEACFDIGSHVISASGYREPRFGRDVFEILAENGWIDQRLRDRLVSMAGFRNVLVHDYATVDVNIVYGVLQARLPDLRTFGTSVLRRLADR